MPIRNCHKVGDWLMQDDESGFTHYRSEMVQLWNGLWVHKSEYETRNPQEFVRAKADPYALNDVRPTPDVGTVCLFTSPVVGETTTPTPNGPGVNFAGIGDMTISTGQTDTDTCGPFCVYYTSQL